MAQKALTQIAGLAQQLFNSLPKGSPESNQAFRIWKLADEGDARTLSDEPTVKEEKRAVRKAAKKSR